MSTSYKIVSSDNRESPRVDDQLLWRDFKSGNKKSFELLYKKLFFKLYNYGYQQTRDKELIQDCLHDLFLGIWKNKETIIEPQSVKNYLFISFKRKMIDALKVKGRFSGDQPFLEPEEYSIEQDIIAEQAEREKNKRVLNAMKHLTPRQKEAVFLRFFEDMEYKDIAQVLGYDTNSVYVLISRAISVLRKYISYIILIIFSQLLLVL